MGIAQDPELPGYEDFEKQAWGFKVKRVCTTHIALGIRPICDVVPNAYVGFF